MFDNLNFDDRPFHAEKFYENDWTWVDFTGSYALLLLCAVVVSACIMAFPRMFTRWIEEVWPTWASLTGGVLTVALVIASYVVSWRMMGPIGEHLPAQSFGGKLGSLFFWLMIVASSFMFAAVLVPLKLLRVRTGRAIAAATVAALLPTLLTTVNLAFTGIPVLSNGLTVLSLVVLGVFLLPFFLATQE